MEITKYYFDACQQEVPSSRELVTVKFAIHFNVEDSPSTDALSGGSNICPDCLSQLGFDNPTLTHQNRDKFRSEFWSAKRVSEMFKTFCGLFRK